MQTGIGRWRAIAAVAFAAGSMFVSPPGVAGEEQSKPSAKEAAAVVNLDYRRTPLDRVLEHLSRAARGVNIQISAADAEEEEAFRQIPVTIKLSNVNWRTALDLVAAKTGFLVNDSRENEGVILLERPPRVTMNVQGADLTSVIKLIAAQSGKNIIPGPAAAAVKGVSFDIRDVPWREALESILKTYQLAMIEDKSGIIRVVSAKAVEEDHEIRAVPLRFIQPYGSRYKVTSAFQSGAGGKSGEEASITSLINVLSQIKSEKGSINYEGRSNMLIIKDTPANIDRMVELIKRLDREVTQIKIAVRMLKIRSENADLLGVNWANGLHMSATGGNWLTTFPFSMKRNDDNRRAFGWGMMGPYAPVGYATNGPVSLRDYGGTVTETNPYTLGTLSFSGLQAVLQVMKQSSNVTVVQAPEIITMDHTEATIHVGQVIRTASYATTMTSSGTTSGWQAEPPINVGVQLIVTPHVCGNGDQVVLEMVPTTEDLDRMQQYGNGEITLPQTSTKTVVTKMRLKDNETGVIAGLLTEVNRRAEDKVPVLGDVPVFGYIFKRRSKGTVQDPAIKENITILVTPTILNATHNEEFEEELARVRELAAASLPAGIQPAAAESVKQ